MPMLPASLFQSTHPRGVRLDEIRVKRGFIRVSIHAPAWGATVSFNNPTETQMFQSTHPRGVRRVQFLDLATKQKVSIHAPAWGVTLGVSTAQHGDIDVSIHAPAWGATYSGRWRRASEARFNPRTRVGCDIHQVTPKRPPLCFNPRTRVGCDAFSFSSFLQGEEFQSTHPRGVRLFPCFIQ